MLDVLQPNLVHSFLTNDQYFTILFISAGSRGENLKKHTPGCLL